MRPINYFILIYKIIFAFLILSAFSNLIHAQEYVSYYAIVQDHETNLPIDSANVTLLRDNIPIDSAVTDTNGVAILKAPVTNVTPNYTQLPTSFQVQQNYPNPSFQRTNIPFTITRNGDVTYKLFNILGQEVISGTERLQPGHYRLLLDGLNALAKGVYILNISTQGNSQTIKMVNLGKGGQPFALTPKIMSNNNVNLNDQSKIHKITQQNLDNLSLRVSKEYYHHQEQTISSDTTYFALERSRIVVSGFVYAVDTSRIGTDLIPVADADVWLGTRTMEDPANIRTTSYSDGSFELYVPRAAEIDTLHAMAPGWNVWNRVVDTNADTLIMGYLLDPAIDIDLWNWSLFLNDDDLALQRPHPDFQKQLGFHQESGSAEQVDSLKSTLEIFSLLGYNAFIATTPRTYGNVEWRNDMMFYGSTHYSMDSTYSKILHVEIGIYSPLKKSLLKHTLVKELFINSLFGRGDIRVTLPPEKQHWQQSFFYVGSGQTPKLFPSYDLPYAIAWSKIKECEDYRINIIRSDIDWW